MSRPTEYVLPIDLIALLAASKRSLHLLRLFHACFAYTDRTPGLSAASSWLPKNSACQVRCSDLAAITGSPSAKSATWIREAVEGGGWTDLFYHLATDETGRILSFKFSRRVGEIVGAKGPKTPFAMVDSDEVGTISSANELLFYSLAVLVARREHPMFLLPYICPVTSPWNEAAKKGWLRIAARVGQRLNQDYVVIPVRDTLTMDIRAVRVKVITATSIWAPGRLFPRPPAPPVAVVRGGAFELLNRRKLIERANWTSVTGE